VSVVVALELELELHPFNPATDGPPIAKITSRLRRRHATDATYSCLAQRLESSMWTLDGKLARNAADCDLPVALVS
jgi:predicted nucleic acid-binding protein